MTKQTQIVTRQIINGLGEKVWQFGVPSILHKGTISWSLHNWKSKDSARRAGRRSFQ